MFTSCSTPNQANGNNKDLSGKWELVKSINFWPVYSEIDWTDSIETKSIEFLNKEKLIIEFPNNIEKECGWTVNGDSLFICDELYFKIIIIDTLVLSQSHIDGPSEYFIKSKI